MKKVIIQNQKTVSIESTSLEKVYVVKYESCDETRYALIRAIHYNCKEYEAISTCDFTKGSRYSVGLRKSLEGIISSAILAGDEVFEFDSIKEAFTYLAENI